MGRRVYATVAAKLGIGCGDVPVAPLASHLAAMPRGLRHSKPIWFGAAWRDARRCGRSRVGWVGGSAIGLEDPAQVGDLRGFVGVLGSPCAPRGRVDLIESASAELPNAVCAPAATYLVVPEMISRTSQMSVLR